MKRSVIFIIVLLCVAWGACKKASGPANGKSVQLDNNRDSLVNMNAAVNGNGWHTDSAFGYKVRSSGNDSSASGMMITAVNKNNGNPSTITFFINNYKGLARYSINPPFVTATYYLGTTRHYATYGDVNFTSNANYSLIGDFYFLADSFSINGSFNVALP
ncbi:MAG: hypothetical protein JWQ38_2692 [Flavipsychrobacter sp.]|nr:hypothetical protein [Flavipsychrobacter sp.]